MKDEEITEDAFGKDKVADEVGEDEIKEEPEETPPPEESPEEEVVTKVEEEELVEEEKEAEEPIKPVNTPVILDQEEKEDDFPEETINEQFEKEEEESLAEHHESAKKGDKILELISLNHRYMFIKELFNNDKNEFENALFELEDFASFDESVEYLVQSYAKHNSWDMQSDEVKEFLKVLFRRFR